MDFVLRCNSLKCRTQLTDRAVVTTCSHIFCIPCSEKLGLAAANGQQRNCPACRAPLANPDDVVATSLNPTEDYKTSVLSGLSPTVIMECATRGLTFWSYQSTQEVVYQEYLAKTLTEKYNVLNNQMDKLVHDANAEIDGLNHRVSQLQIDQDKLKQDNQTLLNALREKNRKHAQTQDAYDRLKRKEMTAATQNAAFDSVDDVLHTAGNHRPVQVRGVRESNNAPVPSFAQAGFSGQHQSHNAPIHIRADSGEMPKPSFLADRFSNNIHGVTPSSSHHRTRLGAGVYQTSQAPQAPLFHRPSNLQHSIGPSASIRRPLESISGNASSIRRDHSNAGYGLSAGMRAGSLHGGLSDGGNRGGSWIG